MSTPQCTTGYSEHSTSFLNASHMSKNGCRWLYKYGRHGNSKYQTVWTRVLYSTCYTEDRYGYSRRYYRTGYVLYSSITVYLSLQSRNLEFRWGRHSKTCSTSGNLAVLGRFRDNLCGWGNNEQQTYTTDNYQVEDGVLTISVSFRCLCGICLCSCYCLYSKMQKHPGKMELFDVRPGKR